MPLVSISDAQRRPLPWANWQATIHHGLPRNLYTFHPRSQGYLAFLGRISPEKRPDHAIEIAKRTGLPLRIAAKVDPADQQYYRTEIEPLLDHPLIEFIGEISDAEKNEFVGNAMALVCPYDWPEPFGLVLIEALACGTPVLAYRRGSIPEVIDHGTTGLVCETLSEMVEAVGRVSLIDRHRCRVMFEERFTADRMARDYVALYERIIEDRITGVGSGIRSIGSRPLSDQRSGARQHEMAVGLAGGRHA
jgi:glycosyltransferase involved in cell wall biosynthesis